MNNHFQIRAINKENFTRLFKLTDDELKQVGARRMVVSNCPGYPCRVSLKDAAVGEKVLALNYQHQIANTPYQASGPIFVRKDVETAALEINQIPKMLEHRLLSLRAYNRAAMMIDAEVVEGVRLRESITNQLKNVQVAYLHIHNAMPGCFNCVVYRA